MEKMTRVAALKKFFATPDKPLDNAEFKAFWQSMSDEARTEMASAAAKELGVELEVAPAQPAKAVPA